MIVNNSVNVLKPDMEKVKKCHLSGILYYMFNSQLLRLLQHVPDKEFIGKLGNCANSQLFILPDYTPYREHSNIGIHDNRGVTYVLYYI
jgi:hypothetical protein